MAMAITGGFAVQVGSISILHEFDLNFDAQVCSTGLGELIGFESVPFYAAEPAAASMMA